MVNNSQTPASLLERLHDGTAAMAWEEFFGRYWRLIHAWAKRRGCSEHTAEEIVQDVMLEIFQTGAVFRYDPARGRFRNWLFAVVRNIVARHRRQPSQQFTAQGSDRLRDFIPSDADNTQPDAAWEAAFEEAMLGVLLDVVRREVTPETYQAFELVTIGELSGARVAAITGLSRNAVYLARKRVLKRLGELGACYREDGRLDQRVKAALQSPPEAAIERSMTARIDKTMRFRGDLLK